ncbi:MAG: 50S ribosomal protein L21 [Alphaproteobacteria bacterium]
MVISIAYDVKDSGLSLGCCKTNKNENTQLKRIKAMFAVIKTGGKQYKVQKDDKLLVEKLEGEDGSKITLDEVLMVADGKTSKIGEPLVKGATVEATLVRQTRGPKITVFKKKRRQNYRRKKGHRQDLTMIQITNIKAA